MATHPTFGGAIRVVIVQEKTGPEFLYCTDTTASAADVLEAYADRSAIEQVFHDVKEVWGSGQQQVRNLERGQFRAALVAPVDVPFDAGMLLIVELAASEGRELLQRGMSGLEESHGRVLRLWKPAAPS